MFIFVLTYICEGEHRSCKCLKLFSSHKCTCSLTGLNLTLGIDILVMSSGRSHPDQAFSTVAQHMATPQIYLDMLFSDIMKEKANNT